MVLHSWEGRKSATVTAAASSSEATWSSSSAAPANSRMSAAGEAHSMHTKIEGTLQNRETQQLSLWDKLPRLRCGKSRIDRWRVGEKDTEGSCIVHLCERSKQTVCSLSCGGPVLPALHLRLIRTIHTWLVIRVFRQHLYRQEELWYWKIIATSLPTSVDILTSNNASIAATSTATTTTITILLLLECENLCSLIFSCRLKVQRLHKIIKITKPHKNHACSTWLWRWFTCHISSKSSLTILFNNYLK